MKASLFLLSILCLSLSDGIAAEAPKSDKTITIDIPSGLPPPSSSEEMVPGHPFFAAPSTGNEVMEKVQELEDRLEKLEQRVSGLEKEGK